MTEKTALTNEERVGLVRIRVQETGKLDPNIPFHLDGTDYTLRYTNRAVKDILADTGLNLLQVSLTAADMADPLIIGSLVFRGLQSKHPDLTQERVDDMLTMRHTLYVQSQVAMALSLFYPDVADLPLLDDTRPEAGSEDPTRKPADSGSATGRLAQHSDYQKESSGSHPAPVLLPDTESSSLSGHSGETSSQPS